MRVVRFAALAALPLLVLTETPPLPAQAPSRADLLVAEREARAEELAPPERTRIEEGLAFVERASQRFNSVRGNETGLHYSSGDFPPGAGFGFGVGYTHNGMAGASSTSGCAASTTKTPKTTSSASDARAAGAIVRTISTARSTEAPTPGWRLSRVFAQAAASPI
jgi:hypothetical protein